GDAVDGAARGRGGLDRVVHLTGDGRAARPVVGDALPQQPLVAVHIGQVGQALRVGHLGAAHTGGQVVAVHAPEVPVLGERLLGADPLADPHDAIAAPVR